jgi:hypothetical protein
LHEWLQYRDSFLLEILRSYGLGDYSQITDCATCHLRPGKFRCSDCFPHSSLRCVGCLLENHKENPLHQIEVCLSSFFRSSTQLLLLQEWNGTFFEKRQLKDLGLRVQLGHGGRPCPCPAPGSSDFVIIHVNGVHHVNVDFCDCGSLESPSPHPRVQLLRFGWFPATFERPKTAFTFDLLKLFHKVTLQGKTTLYDFYMAIIQLSDSLEIDKSTVSNNIFLWIDSN